MSLPIPGAPDCRPFSPLLTSTPPHPRLFSRISQSVRILGSLVAILLVFLTTAILVKVEMEPLPFFIITMIKIVLINCNQGTECGQFWAWVGSWGGDKESGLRLPGSPNCQPLILADTLSTLFLSIWCRFASQPFWSGWRPASQLHSPHHEWPRPGWLLRLGGHDLCHCQ